jgi:hypothetical protein
MKKKRFAAEQIVAISRVHLRNRVHGADSRLNA